MVKRGVDLVVAAALLLLALPILLLAALIIRISSPGPVLFRQVRMGRNFQPFEILKLRTMAHGKAGLAFTFGSDPRITRFGRWLRRAKVDELPQLWNVLRGEMSLVGPRPVLPEITSEFHSHYKLLLRARPGLTDAASLKYSQEARLLQRARDPMSFFKTVVTPDKIRISLAYMESANFWSDAVTLAMTALVCCFPAIGAVYGRLPDPASGLSPVLPLPTMANLASAATDGCAFSYELALAEATAASNSDPTVQHEPAPAQVPWIPWRFGPSRSQSTPSGAREGASRL